jgi:hypothetical protein
MSTALVTRSTVPADNVTRLADWKPRYANVKAGVLGHPVVELKTAAKTLYLQEAAIECSLRDYAKAHGLRGQGRLIGEVKAYPFMAPAWSRTMKTTSCSG